MKKIIEKVSCEKCSIEYNFSKIYKLSYRYTDKKKKYQNSNKNFIITGYMFLCRTCLLNIIK